MEELKKFINEVLEDIDLAGADCPAVLYSEKSRPENIIDYLLKEDADAEAREEGLHIDEIRTEMPLFQVLIELVNALKNKAAGEPTAYTAATISAARNVKRLTQAELGEKIGASGKVVQNWESGFRKPKLETALKIMNVCGINQKYILQYYM